MTFARVFAVFAGLVAVALLVLAGTTATSDLHYSGLVRTYDCGSVLSAKDPRDLAPKQASVPRALISAASRCDDVRSTQSRRAATYLVAGTVVLLVALVTPVVANQARRRRRRRRLV